MDTSSQRQPDLADLEWFPRGPLQGYIAIRMFPTGLRAGVLPMIHTAGLCVGLDESSYESRYCYETPYQALKALASWDGQGDPGGAWIKQKGLSIDRMNPNP